MLGRGTRPLYADGFDLTTIEGRLAAIANSAKQNCLVLDFAGNTGRLGPVNDPVVPRKKGKGAPADAPVKLCGSCACWNHASVTHCAYCGAEFTFTVKLKQTASEKDLMRVDAPIVESFAVDHITYSPHSKAGRPPMMKVTYYCGLRAFSEYVCFEHTGFALRKARQWWRERSNTPVPETTNAGLEAADTVNAATHVRVWVNKPYPEIMGHCFDGTCFGQQEAGLAAPTVDTRGKQIAQYEDDIPF